MRQRNPRPFQLSAYSTHDNETRLDISSLLVPDAKFQEGKSDYLEQLSITPEMIAKQLKEMKDNKSPGVDVI